MAAYPDVNVEIVSDAAIVDIVEQGFEEQVPKDRWFEALTNVADDYPAAQQRALELQQEFKDQNVTWEKAVGALIDEARRLR
jgi:hypothetical protein